MSSKPSAAELLLSFKTSGQRGVGILRPNGNHTLAEIIADLNVYLDAPPHVMTVTQKTAADLLRLRENAPLLKTCGGASLDSFRPREGLLVFYAQPKPAKPVGGSAEGRGTTVVDTFAEQLDALRRKWASAAAEAMAEAETIAKNIARVQAGLGEVERLIAVGEFIQAPQDIQAGVTPGAKAQVGMPKALPFGIKVGSENGFLTACRGLRQAILAALPKDEQDSRWFPTGPDTAHKRAVDAFLHPDGVALCARLRDECSKSSKYHNHLAELATAMESLVGVLMAGGAPDARVLRIVDGVVDATTSGGPSALGYLLSCLDNVLYEEPGVCRDPRPRALVSLGQAVMVLVMAHHGQKPKGEAAKMLKPLSDFFELVHDEPFGTEGRKNLKDTVSALSINYAKEVFKGCLQKMEPVLKKDPAFAPHLHALKGAKVIGGLFGVLFGVVDAAYALKGDNSALDKTVATVGALGSIARDGFEPAMAGILKHRLTEDVAKVWCDRVKGVGYVLAAILAFSSAYSKREDFWAAAPSTAESIGYMILSVESALKLLGRVVAPWVPWVGWGVVAGSVLLKLVKALAPEDPASKRLKEVVTRCLASVKDAISYYHMAQPKMRAAKDAAHEAWSNAQAACSAGEWSKVDVESWVGDRHEVAETMRRCLRKCGFDERVVVYVYPLVTVQFPVNPRHILPATDGVGPQA